MDASASKRRKTSPTASVPVADKSLTPLGLPPLESQSQQARQQSGGPSASRNPSQQHSSSSPSQRASGAAAARRREASASQRSDSLPASQPSSQGQDAASSVREAQSDPARQRVGLRSSRSPSTAATATATAAAAATITAPTPSQPRPLPPPGPEIEEDIANPPMRRSPRLSPTSTTDTVPQPSDEEPELPPTPRRPDPVVSTPPSGIHNTPSKKRRDASDRQTAQQQQQQPQPQSSPSKRTLSKEVALRQLSPRKEPHRARSPQKARAGGGASQLKDIFTAVKPTEEEAAPEAPATDTPSEFAAGTNPRRSVRLRGADWEKKQERDALLRELKQLEKDIDLARIEIDNAANGGSTAADKDALLDLLKRSVLPAAKDAEPEPGANWLDAAMNPMAMLGFNGSSSVKLPPAISPSSLGKEEENPPPPKSHHPIPMTATEELPFLQVFTPLTYTSTMTILPPPPSSQAGNDQQQQQHTDQPPLQKQLITIRSANPPGLFTAHVEITTNSRTLAVSGLSVPRLDPAAAPELAPFLERASASSSASQAPYHPALTRNPNIVCWAMAEWYRVALKRAKFWHVLDTQLGQSAHAKSGLVEVVLAIRARKKRKRRQREAAVEGASEEQQDSDAYGLDTLDAITASKRDLLPHMGRTRMDIAVPYLPAGAGAGAGVSENEDGQAAVSELRVNWAIEFDWTGEASSKLSVQVGVPVKWQAVDTRKSIVGIPNLFDRLLQGGEDPLAAVKTVVALLAGEP